MTSYWSLRLHDRSKNSERLSCQQSMQKATAPPAYHDESSLPLAYIVGCDNVVGDTINSETTPLTSVMVHDTVNDASTLLSPSSDSKHLVRIAQQRGCIQAEEEKEGIAKSRRQVGAIRYHAQAAVKEANRIGKQLRDNDEQQAARRIPGGGDGIFLVVNNNISTEQACLSEETRRVANLPSKEQTDIPPPRVNNNDGTFGKEYQVSEYSIGEYDTRPYETSEYKSVYES